VGVLLSKKRPEGGVVGVSPRKVEEELYLSDEEKGKLVKCGLIKGLSKILKGSNKPWHFWVRGQAVKGHSIKVR